MAAAYQSEPLAPVTMGACFIVGVMPKPKSKSPVPRAKTAARRSATKPLVQSSKTVFKGRVFHVTCDHVTEPNGISAIREVIRHSGSVVVLAVAEGDPEPRVLLERQYRYAAKDFILELPAGRIDPGESPLHAGKRELLEETGYTARKWTKALFFYPSPGFLEETMTVYLAQDLRAGKAQPEADEFIQHELVPLSRVLEWVMNGTIRDGKTISSVLWLTQKLQM
jgi:ADP-ribose pyrophosphatase